MHFTTENILFVRPSLIVCKTRGFKDILRFYSKMRASVFGFDNPLCHQTHVHAVLMVAFFFFISVIRHLLDSHPRSLQPFSRCLVFAPAAPKTSTLPRKNRRLERAGTNYASSAVSENVTCFCVYFFAPLHRILISRPLGPF
jgi:hypothetical protein